MSKLETRRSGTAITEAARLGFDPAQVAVIHDTVAKECSVEELHMFLELAARYNLDPFAREIWAVKMGGQNASGGKVTIMVGRDGFLKIANTNPDYEGMEGDVVHANDIFKVTRDKGTPVVDHVYESGPDKSRGEIVGAWAMVYRKGRKPTYFYAPIEEYRPTSESKLKYSPWGAQESAMILKCAQATALRQAFSISGLAGAEEMARQSPDSGVHEPDIEWGEDDDLAMRLRALVDRANEVKPGSFYPAAVSLALKGKTGDEREAYADSIAEFIVSNGGEVPMFDIEGEAEEIAS